MSVGDVAAGAAGFLGCLLMLAIGLLTIGMGYTGIAEEFGTGWGVAALGAGIVFRFTLPLVVGVFSSLPINLIGIGQSQCSFARLGWYS